MIPGSINMPTKLRYKSVGKFPLLFLVRRSLGEGGWRRGIATEFPENVRALKPLNRHAGWSPSPPREERVGERRPIYIQASWGGHLFRNFLVTALCLAALTPNEFCPK
jgi:hypothetical protein